MSNWGGSSTAGDTTRGGTKRLSQEDLREKRERGFSLTGLQAVKLREYNALYDPNMRHFFESRNNQYFLYRTGQIDSNGRVIDLDKNKSKLFILEREFKEAEKIEERRQKEEMEMRVSYTIPFLFLLNLHLITHFLSISIVYKENVLMN